MMRRLGKMLFPQFPSDLQRRKVNILLGVLLFALLLGGLFTWAALVGNRIGPR